MSTLRGYGVALPGALAIFCAAGAAAAEAPPPQNVITLAAQASAEVPRDWLSITLAATRDGSDAADVQSQLRQALDAALAEARKAARPGQVELRTGQFAIFARYAPKGGISGWQGSAELVIEGRDLAAISQLAGRLSPLVVTRVVQSLSREAREKVEGDVAAQAIGRFRMRAETYAKQFGFAGYTVREVAVSGGEPPPVPVPRMTALAASPQAAGEAQPVEVGKATVTVTVSGSVQMTR